MSNNAQSSVANPPICVLQLPTQHLRWDNLLRSLGMRDAPAPADLLQLAADVAAAVGGAPLNANERGAALRLLATLCSDADAAQVRPSRSLAAAC